MATGAYPTKRRAHFRTPNWDAPLEVDERLAQIPPHATVRGVFFNDLLNELPGARALMRRPRYLTFNKYPFVEWFQLLTDSARTCFPDCGEREAVRRIGRRGLPALAESHAGRVLLAMAGNDPVATLKLSSRAFALAQSHGTGTVVSIEPGLALVEIREAWDYPDAYYVGVYEGALDLFGMVTQVEVSVYTLCDVDLRLRWKPR